MSGYLTLNEENHAEFTEKRSRFIGYAKPVSTAGEAVEFIEKIRSVHWDAKHNVYAYVLRESNTKRYSDDGEPQGTAGVPVLDVIEKSGVTDCVVVATRYFGGILLGGGGLVRAYSHTASIALEAAGIVEMKPFCVLKTECDYNFYGKLSSMIPEFAGSVENAEFTDKVSVSFLIPKENVSRFSSKLTDEGRGRYTFEIIEEKYGKMNIETNIL